MDYLRVSRGEFGVTESCGTDASENTEQLEQSENHLYNKTVFSSVAGPTEFFIGRESTVDENSQTKPRFPPPVIMVSCTLYRLSSDSLQNQHDTKIPRI